MTLSKLSINILRASTDRIVRCLGHHTYTICAVESHLVYVWGHKNPTRLFFFFDKERKIRLAFFWNSTHVHVVQLKSHCTHLVKSKHMKPWSTICYLTSLDNFKGGGNKGCFLDKKRVCLLALDIKKTCLLTKTCIC